MVVFSEVLTTSGPTPACQRPNTQLTCSYSANASISQMVGQVEYPVPNLTLPDSPSVWGKLLLLTVNHINLKSLSNLWQPGFLNNSWAPITTSSCSGLVNNITQVTFVWQRQVVRSPCLVHPIPTWWITLTSFFLLVFQTTIQNSLCLSTANPPATPPTWSFQYWSPYPHTGRVWTISWVIFQSGWTGWLSQLSLHHHLFPCRKYSSSSPPDHSQCCLFCSWMSPGQNQKLPTCNGSPIHKEIITHSLCSLLVIILEADAGHIPLKNNSIT